MENTHQVILKLSLKSDCECRKADRLRDGAEGGFFFYLCCVTHRLQVQCSVQWSLKPSQLAHLGQAREIIIIADVTTTYAASFFASSPGKVIELETSKQYLVGKQFLLLLF